MRKKLRDAVLDEGREELQKKVKELEEDKNKLAAKLKVIN